MLTDSERDREIIACNKRVMGATAGILTCDNQFRCIYLSCWSERKGEKNKRLPVVKTKDLEWCLYPCGTFSNNSERVIPRVSNDLGA